MEAGETMPMAACENRLPGCNLRPIEDPRREKRLRNRRIGKMFLEGPSSQDGPICDFALADVGGDNLPTEPLLRTSDNPIVAQALPQYS